MHEGGIDLDSDSANGEVVYSSKRETGRGREGGDNKTDGGGEPVMMVNWWWCLEESYEIN